MKAPISRLFKQHILLSPLEILLILVLLGVTVGVGLYAQYTLVKVRQGLPAEILRQAGDLTLLIQDLAELVHAVEVAVLDTEPKRREFIIVRNESLRNRLAIIQSYEFNNLVGAAAIYALVNPASEDIQRWLSTGLPGLPADSSLVMRLVEIRAQDAHNRARDLSLHSSATALELLDQESMRLERFRGGVLILLVCLVLLSLGVIGLFISQRRGEVRLALLRERLSDAIESIPHGFLLCDAKDHLVVCNEQYRQMYAQIREIAIPGTPFVQIVRALFQSHLVIENENRLEEAIAKRMARHTNPDLPFEYELRDGRRIRIYERHTSDGGTVAIHMDITDMHRDQERLQHMATHDSLTGLPNRSYLQQRLEQALARARRHEERIAVLYLDLDRFKLVNDTLGHHAGDELLQAVAGRLKSHLREEDTLARLGGDEFMVILEDLADFPNTEISAQRLIDALGQPFQVSDHEIFITASIGIAHFPEDGDDLNTLVQNADAASYQAKSEGANQYCLYTPELNKETDRRLKLENDLRHVLKREQLVLYYQPYVAINGVDLIGAEVLLRWQHPELGMIYPNRFVALAEEIGMMESIGEWVLREACYQYSIWQTQGVAPPRLSFNLSSRQLNQPDMLKMVAQVLSESGMVPDNLNLEITEAMLMEDRKENITFLCRLGAMGVHLSVDDFGTGYSSFGILKTLPLDTLKMDGSFVSNLTSSPNDRAIVEAIIAMADALDIKVLAEGVETQGQLELLREQGCAQAQGNYFSPPLPSWQFMEFLQGKSINKAICRNDNPS